jgi:hypothetical protein
VNTYVVPVEYGINVIQSAPLCPEVDEVSSFIIVQQITKKQGEGAVFERNLA